MRKTYRVIALCLAVALLLGAAGCSKTKYISGNEWLVIQEACFDDLKAYAGGMDQIYTLYFIGSISAEDFENELSVLRQQYTLLVAFYDKMKAENPVRENGHSYVSKSGSDSMQRAYDILGEMFDGVHAADGTLKSPDELSYTYLAYRQNFTAELSNYVTALAVYKTLSEEETASPSN